MRDDDFHGLCTDEFAGFELVAAHARRIGFEFCAYGMKLPLPLAQPKFILKNDYPTSWSARYTSQGYLAADPTVQHGLCSNVPIVWSADVFRESGNLWDDANAHGLKHGLGLARRMANGSVGMLTLSRSADAISEVEANEVALEMVRITEMLLIKETNAAVAHSFPESLASLTEREKEILRWTADGKTSSEIGQILNLSAATVNFHINKTLAKLDAVNKTQAVVKAIILGLLDS